MANEVKDMNLEFTMWPDAGHPAGPNVIKVSAEVSRPGRGAGGRNYLRGETRGLDLGDAVRFFARAGKTGSDGTQAIFNGRAWRLESFEEVSKAQGVYRFTLRPNERVQTTS
jgi:hypothetical protein